jgi:hypothetical protein
MSVLFLGKNHDVCKFGPLRMWAERGLIHIEDSRDSSYDSVSVKTALERMEAVSDMIGNSRADRKGFIHEDIRQRWQRMLEEMIFNCQKAKEQGMPSDPTAARDYKIRKTRTFLVCDTGAMMYGGARMPLTPKEAFKVGFMARCIEDGLDAAAMCRAAKTAAEKSAILSATIGAAKDLGKGVMDVASGWGVPLLLAAPPIAGGLAGYGLARATDVDDTDVSEIKDREVIDEYRRQTKQLSRQRAIRDYLKARQRTGRVFM